MSLQIGIIADDITGASMAASLLEAEGIEAPVVTSARAVSHLPDHVEAVVYAGTHRLVPAAEARATVRQVAEALRERGCARLYAKYSATFDSTPAGNIGPVAEELCDLADVTHTVFAPGFPAWWVTVFHGTAFVGRDPMAESFKRHDPVTPMTDSNLVRVLQAQTKWPVGLIDHTTLRQGPEAVQAHVEDRVDRGERFFVVDAVDDGDVEACAAAVAHWPVVTGADALVPALGRAIGLRRDPQRARRRHHPTVAGPLVVLAGSCAAATRAQLDQLGRLHPVRTVEVTALGDDQAIADHARELARWAASHPPEQPVAIATSADEAAVASANATLGGDASRRATALLAEVARELFTLGVRNYVVAGGETTGAVLGALEIERFEVTAFDDLGGGYLATEVPEPMAVVCKAGGLGGPDLLLRAIDALRGSEVTSR